MSASPPHRFVSIGTKLSFIIVALLGGVFAYVYVESTERTRQSLILAKQSASSLVADLFADSLVAPLDFSDADAAQAEINRMAPNSDVIYAAVWATGIDTPVAVLLTEGRGEITGIPASREPRTIALEDRVETVRDVLSPGGKLLGGIVIHFSLARENHVYQARRRRLLFLSVGLTLGVSALLIGLARRMILVPIARIAAAARRMEWGDEASVEVRSNDEIGRLGGAFNAMAAAIADRGRWLAAARSSLQEILDNMRQGIVIFDRDGLIDGASSRQASAIFGTSELQGLAIRDLLYPGAPGYDTEVRAFDEWLKLAFEMPASSWDEIAALAPREVVRRCEEGEICLALEFRPFVEGDRIARIMLLATDETDKRRLERAVQSQEQQHARQMAAMRRMIASGTQLFVSFLNGAKERIARCKKIVRDLPGSLTAAQIDEIFQHVHTIKGEARAFDLRALEIEAAAIEDRLAKFYGRSRDGDRVSLDRGLPDELAAHLDLAQQAIATARALFVEASPIGAAVLDQISVSRTALLEVCDLVSARSRARPNAAPDELARAVARLAARPFGESVASLIEGVPVWAKSMGKKAEIEVEGREVLLPPEVARVLSGVLTNIVRNAVAHGIERPELRAKIGKNPIGLIRITGVKGAPVSLRTDSPDEPSAWYRAEEIWIEDDGAGLDLTALRARAEELQIPIPPEGIAELVFHQGLSTADSVSDIAGRGVGLAAARAELAKVDWEILVSSESRRGTKFTLRPRNSCLPAQAR